MKTAMLGTKGIPATWGGIEHHVEERYSVRIYIERLLNIYARVSGINENFEEGMS